MDPEGEALEHDGDSEPTRSAPSAANSGAYGDSEPCSSSAGPTLPPSKAPDDEPSEGEEADDQALPVAPEGQRDGEGDDRPVEHGHGAIKPGVARARQPRISAAARRRLGEALPFSPDVRAPRSGAGV